jgi:hypothetical protein
LGFQPAVVRKTCCNLLEHLTWLQGSNFCERRCAPIYSSHPGLLLRENLCAMRRPTHAKRRKSAAKDGEFNTEQAFAKKFFQRLHSCAWLHSGYTPAHAHSSPEKPQFKRTKSLKSLINSLKLMGVSASKAAVVDIMVWPTAQRCDDCTVVVVVLCPCMRSRMCPQGRFDTSANAGWFDFSILTCCGYAVHTMVCMP